jgi:hypothetical protein
MAAGLIAAINMSAGVNTVLFTMPAGKIYLINVNVCNRNITDVNIRLALTKGGLDGLADSDYIEYDTIVRPKGVLERTGLVLNGQQSLIGYSDSGNVSFVVWG